MRQRFEETGVIDTGGLLYAFGVFKRVDPPIYIDPLIEDWLDGVDVPGKDSPEFGEWLLDLYLTSPFSKYRIMHYFGLTPHETYVKYLATKRAGDET